MLGLTVPLYPSASIPITNIRPNNLISKFSATQICENIY